MTLDLFPQDSTPSRVSLADFVAAGDRAAALRRLRSLRGLALDQDILRAGFSMISQRHGIQAVIDHVFQQWDSRPTQQGGT